MIFVRCHGGKEMIRYSKSTVFNTQCQAIVNTVNCVGVMGKGIALEYKLRYQDMFNDYQAKCESGMINTGNVDYWSNNEIIIINFPTKFDFKYPSKLEWIEEGLIDFVKTHKKFGINSVAFPKLGVNNGELLWEDVKDIMEKYLSNLDTEIIICLDELEVAEGKELEMVELFNQSSIDKILEKVKLNTKQQDNLEMSKPIRRFRELSRVDSIGSTTYAKLFKYFYENQNAIEFEPLKFDI